MASPRILLNVQTNDVEGARAVSEAHPGRIVVGVPMKGFADVATAATVVRGMHKAGVLISAGLGDGAADQWERAHGLAVETRPFHLNQVFPAAGYSRGALRAVGAETIVNALVRPGDAPGRVVIGTGIHSEKLRPHPLPVELAVALLKDIGVDSVKFFPMSGLTRLDDYAALVDAAAPAGFMVEATGGLTPENLGAVLRVSIGGGAQRIMPHLYSSVKVPGTDLLDPERVAAAVGVIEAAEAAS
ncbi:2-dehydro-3-deoxy-phosphogluconate aldolase [Microbacterium resistens]|uniref:2-dehydro-3-deoxy-phosphogluconate aldolase n=1 Tax=Microbacterium resistens TaxID=156977 RepID=A0ABU1SBG6_9MICO|nr:KDGP aldolase [Microbacterium resistens]MDR6866227.1 2-dehydro-3-deoxy-phosphogluconate aldolase [Microbacterium resistens]